MGCITHPLTQKLLTDNPISHRKNNMEISPLQAVSPIDGRYHNATKKLGDYFSEGALIKYRVRVEVAYFIALCEMPPAAVA